MYDSDNNYNKRKHSRCPLEFVYLYREFGGDLTLKDDQGRLATEIADNAPALQIMKTLQGIFFISAQE